MAHEYAELSSGSGGVKVAVDRVTVGADNLDYQIVQLANGADGSAKTIVGEASPLSIRLSDGTNFITTLPVSLASVPSHAVTNAGTFAVQVDGTALTRLTDIETNTDFGAVVGGGTEATALRVTLANDSTGVLSVDDNGGALTVDNAGTFAVQVDGSLLTAAQAIQTAVEGTLTVGSHAVTNAGTFAVQVNGDALTALQLLDDAVYTDATGTPSKGIAVMGTDGTNPQIIAVDTSGNVQVDLVTANVTNAGTFAVQAAQSGTWTVDLGATDNAVLDSMVTLLTGIDGDTDALVSYFLGVADPKFDNLGSIAAYTELSSDAVQTDDAAYTLGTGKGIMMMGFAGTQSVNANDACALACETDGSLHTLDDNSASIAISVARGALVDDAAFTPASDGVRMAGFFADETTTDSVDEGDGGAARMTLDRKQIVTAQPHTKGGLSISRDIDLDNGTLTVVKASAGQLYGFQITNTSTATVYVKFYDAASGTLGTGTPVLTIGIPGNSSDDTLLTNMFPLGVEFATGICVGAGTGVADADNTDPGTNAVVANIYYK